MQKWAKGCVAVSVLLSGCAIFDKETTETPSTSQVILRIPEGLAKPNQPAAFDIPAVAPVSGQIANKKPPTLILATASSSRLEEEEKLSRVWFERNDLTGDLLPFIQQQLRDFFAAQQVELTQLDDAGLRYETGWIQRSRSSGFWLWKSENPVDQVRYQIELAPRPHGRSLSMTSTLLEHQYFVAGEQLTAQDAKANEVNVLNRIINQVAIAEVQAAREQRLAVAEVSLEPGLDQAGNPALVTRQPTDVTWSQLELLFPELNLTVTDFDRSVLTYYVSYTKPTRGIWRTITFRDAPLSLPLEDGEYQLVLSRHNGTGTAISWQDKSGEPLPPALVSALYEPMVAAIRAAGLEF